MNTRTFWIATLVLMVSGGWKYSRAQDANPLTQLSGSIREITRRVSPGVVEIEASGYALPDDDKRQTASRISRQRARASGIVVDTSGYVMTNAHVVQGADSVKIVVTGAGPSDGNHDGFDQFDTLDARIIGVDRDSDLALLRVNAHLTVLQFGDSDAVRQGDLVFAVGSPMGLRNSLSMGVVSAPARAVRDADPILYIQTDASINPGNSGGALVNTQGLLIGVNSFIVSESGGNEGIGFAIPSNVAHNVYEQLRRKGYVSRGTVGLFVQNITPPIATGLGLPVQRGVVIADVTPRGPGTHAGLKRRDVILSLNGNTMYSARQFDNAIYRRQGGEKIHIVFQRDEIRISATLEVNEQAAPVDPLVTLVSPERNLVPQLGVLCIEIDKNVAEIMPDLRRQYGLIVAAKGPDGQSQFVDLQAGDVIHAVNNQPIATLSMFRKKLGEFKHGDAVALQIERDGRFQYVGFELE